MPSSSWWAGWIRLGKVPSSITKKLVYSGDLCQVIQLCTVSKNTTFHPSGPQPIPLHSPVINEETNIPTHHFFLVPNFASMWHIVVFWTVARFFLDAFQITPFRGENYGSCHIETLTRVSWRLPKHSEIIKHVYYPLQCFLFHFVSQHGQWASHKRFRDDPREDFSRLPLLARKIKCLSSLNCNPNWLFPLVDGCYYGYITKLIEKRNLDTRRIPCFSKCKKIRKIHSLNQF